MKIKMNDLATDHKASFDSGVETSNDSNDSVVAATKTENTSTWHGNCRLFSRIANNESSLRRREDGSTGDLADYSFSFVESLPTINELEQPGSSLPGGISDVACGARLRSCLLFKMFHPDGFWLEESRKRDPSARKRHGNPPSKMLAPGIRCGAIRKTTLSLDATRRRKLLGARSVVFGTSFRSEDGADKHERKTNLAATTNNVELMKLLLETEATSAFKGEWKNAALRTACRLGYPEIVSLLLEHGADAKSRSSSGATPLKLAIAGSHFSVVNLLLSADADLLSVDELGCDALKLAEWRLGILQLCGDADMASVKAETIDIINLLLACLKKRRGFHLELDALSNVCSRLSLSNTAEQVHDQVGSLLSNLDSLRLKS